MNDVSSPELSAATAPDAAASDAQPGPRRRRIWRWVAGVLAAIVLFVAAAALVERWTRVPTLAADNSSVMDQWIATMSRIGIDAVYPPQEDVFVGDVYVKVSNDNASPNSAHVGRSVNVARIDMGKALEQAYRSGYSFPDTLPKPQGDGGFWQQQAAAGSVFAPGAERRNLPLLLLPGFTIAHVRRASAGGGWLSKTFGVLGGVAGEGESTVELKIPVAETYGVPSRVAMQQLDAFCKDPETHEVCTQDGVRNALLSNVGSDVFDRMPCPEPGKAKAPQPCPPEESRPYRLDMEIHLLYRVYLTRSIETVTRASSSFAAQATGSAKLGEDLRQLQATAPVVPEAPANANPGEAAALRRALEAHKARLDALAAQIGAAPGATAGVQSADASSVSVTQNLQRPVVIGFRSVLKFPE